LLRSIDQVQRGLSDTGTDGLHGAGAGFQCFGCIAALRANNSETSTPREFRP
jgi:hypothetical protein